MDRSQHPEDFLLDDLDEHVRNLVFLSRTIMKNRAIGKYSHITDGHFSITRRRCGKKNCKCATSKDHLHPQMRFIYKLGQKSISAPVTTAQQFERYLTGTKLHRQMQHEIDEITACCAWLLEKQRGPSEPLPGQQRRRPKRQRWNISAAIEAVRSSRAAEPPYFPINWKRHVV